MRMAGVYGVALRLLTSGSRYVLVLAAARFLGASGLGVLSLVLATASLGTHLFGLQVFAVSGRELAGETPETQARILRDQLGSFLVSYPLALLVMLGVFVGNVLPWELAGWVYALVIAEHLASEAQRLLVFLGRPVLSNVSLFIRHGLWPLLWAPLAWWMPELRTLETVFAFWWFAAVASLVPFATGVRRLDLGTAIAGGFDWGWIRGAIRAALPILGAAVLTRGVFVLDRFVLQGAVDESAVGIYAFFFSLAQLLVIVPDTGVLLLLTPSLIEARRESDADTYAKLSRELLLRVAGSVVALAGGIALLIHPLLSLLDRPGYEEGLSTLWVLLAALSLMAFAGVARLHLYVRGLDGHILVALAISTTAALVAHPLLAASHGHLGTAWATLITAGVLATVMQLQLWRAGTFAQAH